jgi:transaldolase/glucose-6-phosphate isomerase
LMGIDVEKLLAAAEWMSAQCAVSVPAERNPGLALGAVLGQMSLDGRDKLTLISDQLFAPFGPWLEQLIAESSGKNGKGIVVVDGEPLGQPENFGNDRLVVYFRSSGDFDNQISDLISRGHPVLRMDVENPYNLGAEFYKWEVAVSIACAVLGVNAFDQPDVQFSKDITKKKITQYAKSKNLDEGIPMWSSNKTHIFSTVKLMGDNLKEILYKFLLVAGPNDFIGINAYIPRNPSTIQILTELRHALRQLTGCATTVGFGPRFLHSTGQLHKGGENNGVFVQITVDPEKDLEIPTQNISFGILERAQALGDYEALAANRRRIIRIHFESIEKLKELVASLKGSN